MLPHLNRSFNICWTIPSCNKVNTQSYGQRGYFLVRTKTVQRALKKGNHWRGRKESLEGWIKGEPNRSQSLLSSSFSQVDWVHIWRTHCLLNTIRIELNIDNLCVLQGGAASSQQNCWEYLHTSSCYVPVPYRRGTRVPTLSPSH